MPVCRWVWWRTPWLCSSRKLTSYPKNDSSRFTVQREYPTCLRNKWTDMCSVISDKRSKDWFRKETKVGAAQFHRTFQCHKIWSEIDQKISHLRGNGNQGPTRPWALQSNELVQKSPGRLHSQLLQGCILGAAQISTRSVCCVKHSCSATWRRLCQHHTEQFSGQPSRPQLVWDDGSLLHNEESLTSFVLAQDTNYAAMKQLCFKKLKISGVSFSLRSTFTCTERKYNGTIYYAFL